LSKRSKRQQPQNRQPARQPNRTEVAVAPIHDKYSSYPSNGLTPVRLAQIFREADAGDVLRQMELFEEMEEKDPHLFSQLQTRKNAVTGLDYEVLPFSDDETDKEIAEFVREQLEGLENLEDIMMDLLDAIGKGISVSEIMWGYDDGHTVIEDVKWRHPKRFKWDQDDTFKVETLESPNGIPLPDYKFIVHRYKARSGHPARAGVLRVVAWMYLFKNYDLKDWVSFCEVFGMPLRLGKYNPSASEDDKLALMAALVRLGTDAAGIIPDGTSIEFKEASKTSSINVYESLARYCDEQISKAVLGQTLTSDSGNGSYSQSKTHNEVRHDLTVADCKALAATLRRDLIRPLVYFNYGEARRIPSIRFDVEEAEDLKQTAEIYDTLITHIGLKVPTSHIRKKFGIPKPEAGEEIATPPANTPLLPFKLSAHKAPAATTVTGQAAVDRLADTAINQGAGVWAEIFAPLLGLTQEAGSLEAIRAKLESDAGAAQLYKQMDVVDLDELLAKAMFYADLMGRAEEHGPRSD